ncbi:hypothetical protein WOLCODRAFT_89955 [Wolfiporia cocos MD-104 SS10]|uniref:SAM domain-containing protein n=1 Tax=Wolfiporia cocos (strain MD-104) TaxID=742152 RepID=A0A2H3JLC6_WOLCO|nr:hypothetical protein WOLCODRAFT_89955 [Wolfiporia cocos MD-104 SS10]
MSTEKPLPVPPSPTSPKYSFPAVLKHDPNLKPNPHPYAVKTTTSGVLSRSNSSSHNVNVTRHYYVPSSPSTGHSPDNGKSHKMSKSLSTIADSPTRPSPRPLPTPPMLTAPLIDDHQTNGLHMEGEHQPSRRNKRAETLPSIPSDSYQAPTPLVVPTEDLPPNPKLWTPAQLSTYLVTALRISSQGKQGDSQPIVLPSRVAKDIAAFAKARLINGRMFLRLTDAELESMGMNKKWREALLVASQQLRQNVLKGRIWGPEVSRDPSPNSTSPLPIHPFSSSLYSSSTSSLELSADEGDSGADTTPSKRVRLTLVCSNVFSALRVFAIGGREWLFATVTFLLGMVPVATNLFGDVKTIYSTIFTYRILKEAHRANIKASVVTLLLRDGTALLILNVLHLSLSLTNVFLDVTYFVTAFSSIIVSRFLLNLRQIHLVTDDDDSNPSFVQTSSDQGTTLEFNSTISTLDQESGFMDCYPWEMEGGKAADPSDVHVTELATIGQHGLESDVI